MILGLNHENEFSFPCIFPFEVSGNIELEKMMTKYPTEFSFPCIFPFFTSFCPFNLQALDLKPNYVRAWANMGISYANQVCYLFIFQIYFISSTCL